MSDAFWTALVGGIVSLALGAMQVWMTIKLRSIGKTADATHEIVNSQRTEMMTKIEDLRNALSISQGKEK